MIREVKFDPVKLTVLGVKVYCANDAIATELLLNIKEFNLSIDGAIKERQAYFFDSRTATKSFLKVYNENSNRN